MEEAGKTILRLRTENARLRQELALEKGQHKADSEAFAEIRDELKAELARMEYALRVLASTPTEGPAPWWMEVAQAALSPKEEE